jgi:hypothetical protein
MKNISDRIIGKTETHFMFANFFFSKIVPFVRYMEKYCRARQATVDSMVRMRIPYWISKATNKHIQVV